MSDQPGPRSRGGRFLFPLITLALVLLLFAVLEGALSFFDVADPESKTDPLVAFTEIRPLFILNEAEGRYETAPSRKIYFNFDTFAVQKPSNGFRIFCLGGSTVAGRPYAIATSFTKWLEIGLGAADPSREWKVVNCGGVSYASYRLLPILEEVLQYDPDFVILYTGQNEFLEDRTYDAIKHLPAYISKPLDIVSQFRTFTLLRSFFELSDKSKDPKNTLPTEVKAWLDYKDGLAQFKKDPVWRQGVVHHFDQNLHRMIHLSRESAVPILIVNPGCNLRDCPPFKSLPKEGLTAEEIGRFQSLIEEARESYHSDPNRSVALLLEATEIDDQNAAGFYELAKGYDAVGRIEEAFEAYDRAKELDICPLRILDSMNRSILDLASDESVPMVDAKTLLIGESEDGIPGNDVYIDHVHPTIGSHEKIANAIADKLIDVLGISPPDGWNEARDELFREHLASLDKVYFAKGLDRLKRLQSWAAGESDETPPISAPSANQVRERTASE
ncbi:MAG: SGNH/GDSL hydrolase family protein [Candidatus Omnitrophica bacterium]|nr:SGNH/GDSL hydrolase family protein [Candidatus Omnitrophota bacterium]